MNDHVIGLKFGLTVHAAYLDKPISVYKYLEKKDLVHWTEHKTVKIDTIASFASQENKGGRGDPLEVEIAPADVSFASSADEKNQQAIKNLGFLGLGAQNTVDYHCSGCKFTIPNQYAFCVSSKLSKRMFKRWNETEYYDTVIRIKDFISFLLYIQLADANAERRFINSAHVDLVKYAQTPIDVYAFDLQSHKFIKDQASFRWQKEMRASWEIPLFRQKTAKTYYLHVPQLDQLIDIVKVPKSWMFGLKRRPDES